MKKTDLAYIAGIIDGEGCIYIERGKKGRGFQLSVSVGSSDKCLCELLKFSFGGCVYQMKSKTLPMWKWEIRTRQAGQFLESILPYLRLKQPQAEIAIKFQKARHTVNWQRKTDEEKAVEEAQYILLRNLKQKRRQVLNNLTPDEAQSLLDDKEFLRKPST
jgi:hypothetical protein